MKKISFPLRFRNIVRYDSPSTFFSKIPGKLPLTFISDLDPFVHQQPPFAMIHPEPSPSTVFTTPSSLHRKRKSYQPSESTTCYSPSSSFSFWDHGGNRPKVAIGCLPAQNQSKNTDGDNCNNRNNHRLIGSILPGSTNFGSSEHWVSFYKRFQTPHIVERALRGSIPSNSKEQDSSSTTGVQGSGGVILRMFLDCTRPRHDATYDDDDGGETEQGGWIETQLFNDYPLRRQSHCHYLDIRRDNTKWHFNDEDRGVVEHAYNLIE